MHIYDKDFVYISAVSTDVAARFKQHGWVPPSTRPRELCTDQNVLHFRYVEPEQERKEWEL